MLQQPSEIIEDSIANNYSSDSEDLSGLKILVAEDSIDNQELIQIMLMQGWGKGRDRRKRPNRRGKSRSRILRRNPHGYEYAGNGRLRGHAIVAQPGIRPADSGLDGQCHVRRQRTLPGRRMQRPPGQTDRSHANDADHRLVCRKSHSGIDRMLCKMSRKEYSGDEDAIVSLYVDDPDISVDSGRLHRAS